MLEALELISAAFVDVNWLEGIEATASFVTACIAYFALENWKQQDKAKREAEFLDALVEALHTYVVEMHSPLTHMRMVRIGMMCHGTTQDYKEEKISFGGAVAYIQKDELRTADRLQNALRKNQTSVIRLRSLAAKGQIFNFKGYANCYNAIALITWQFERMEAFLTVIQSPTMNWDHPRVIKLLNDVIAIEPDDLVKGLSENNVTILEFVKETYKRLYN
jgi:hypothetical protein